MHPSASTRRFSERVQRTPLALSIYINEIVYAMKRQGADIVTLSLGEAFFDIPMFDFNKLDFVKGYHYCDSQGLPELRQVISRFYGRQYEVPVKGYDEVLVTAGSKAAIYLSVLAVLGRGDEALVHEPAWLSYQEHVRLADAEMRFIPFSVPVDEFESFFSESTRLLIINNPNNPAGKIYEPHELRLLVELCRRRGVWLLVDEAYSDFAPPGTFHSVLEYDPDRTTAIVANSLSKNLGMSGWRIGYIIANPALIGQVLKLNQHIITCAPTILQAYLARYFDEIFSITLPQAQDIAEKRARVAARMASLGISTLSGGATFYFFVSIGDFPASSLDFSLYLLFTHNIAVVPGSAYGASTERFVRLSIGTESEERIEEALAIIANTLYAKPDVGPVVSERLAGLGIGPFIAANGA
jgi:aspartate/methionine/tyrosine aminotransferase